VNSINKSGPDPVFEAAKKAAPVSLLLTALATGISYVAYSGDLAVSVWPWRIGLVVMLICSLAPFLVYFMAHPTNALWAYGVIVAIAIFAIYYFFGIFAYFYYFIFSPMSGLMRWAGLLGGGALTIYWLSITRRSINHTIESWAFQRLAFIDDGEKISYDIQKGMRNFEKLHKERLLFPKALSYIAYGIAPFCLILSRLLQASFGSTGVLLFLAVFGMPLSLWLAAVFLRVCLVMVALPIRIERKQNKHVVVTT
jgi:hypothetical protein